MCSAHTKTLVEQFFACAVHAKLYMHERYRHVQNRRRAQVIVVMRVRNHASRQASNANALGHQLTNEIHCC